MAKASQAETGGGEGVEVRVNEPFNVEQNKHNPEKPLLDNRKEGQFTHKIFHLAR